MTEQFILLRHGESESSAAGIADGDPASSTRLTGRGREQARAAGGKLADVSIDLCATSRFLRVRETADLVLEGRSVPRIVLPELDDLRGGEFDGRPLEEYRAWARVHAMSTVIPGGESRVALALRYCRAIRSLLERAEHTVLVIAHGLPLTYVIRAAAGELPQPVMPYLTYAEPHEASADSMRRAVERLEQWAEEPVAP